MLIIKIVGLLLAITVIVICVVVCNRIREGPLERWTDISRRYIMDVYQKRKMEMEQQEEQYGICQEKGILQRLDRMLEEAGIRKNRTIMTAETYLLIVLVTVLVTAVIVRVLWKNNIALVCCCLCICFLYGVFLYIKAGGRYKRTEKQLLVFINLLDNYSKTSDDLVEIIARTEKVLNEPLKSAISEFHWEAVHTGEIETALRHLSVKLPHRKLKEVIRNLDICRRHEANYGEIIKDMRVSMKEYLHAKEERKTIRQTARMNTVAMCLVGAFILNMVNGFMGGALWQLLLQNMFGTFIILYLFLLVLVSVVSLIRVDRT